MSNVSQNIAGFAQKFRKMKRYLIYFSYVGKGYSGLQIQKQPGVKTVAGAILHAARSLRPEDICFKSSSRTDRGVHAICNTATLDVLESQDNPVNGKKITSSLNEQFFHDKEDIRILHTRRVPLTFSARVCLSRSYLYRFCSPKTPDLSWNTPFPPMEYQKLWLLREPLDVEAMKEGAKLMSGTHDFSYFTTMRFDKEKNWRNPVKELDVQIQECPGCLDGHVPYFKEYFNSFEAVFTSGSFLYRQIRFMMATLTALGQGKTSLEDLHKMLDNPQKYREDDPKAFNNKVPSPAYALYLRNVVYDEKDLEVSPEEAENEDLEIPSWLVNKNNRNWNVSKIES